jgi:hypothetical protein
MARLVATSAHYIKLGRGGEWAAQAIGEGVLRFGYSELPHDLCVAGEWGGAREAWRVHRGGNDAVLTSDMNQARTFYTAPETSVFITFHAGRMYWCRPRGPVELLADGTKRRGTVDGWHGQTVGGDDLFYERLSGRLLKVQGFRGTICGVDAEDYLLRKLGDEVTPQVEAAVQAEMQMIAAISGLMGLLTWQDFELLVDLVFSSSGWKRTGATGGVQNTVDIELMLPSTQERAFVQVKSQATPAQLADYVGRMAEMDGVHRMFFVWHTGDVGPAPDHGRVTLVGPDQLARMVLDAGLATWLRQKVS